MRAVLARLVTAVLATALLAAEVAARAQSSVSGITGGVSSHTVVAGDTWQGLAARFGVEPATLATDNGLTLRVALKAGQVLRVDNRHVVPPAAEPGVVVVNVPQRMLFYADHEGMAAIPVAVGQPGWKTPLGPFTVVFKETNPTWEVPLSIQEEARRAGRYLPPVVAPGRKNPLGRFWIGLSIPSLGIHGTNAPSSIYRAATHGCIRVGAPGIEWLFERVDAGTPGRIIYEPILLAVVDHQVFLEVHDDVYRRQDVDAELTVRDLAARAGIEGQIDWETVRAVLAGRHGVARSVSSR